MEEVSDVQKVAFAAICDTKTARLRLNLATGEGRHALRSLNEACAATMERLDKLTKYCHNSTLGQGACLVVAVLKELHLMESAWCGPAADLSCHAVQVLQQFKGKKQKRKVGFADYLWSQAVRWVSGRMRDTTRATPIHRR